MRTFQFTKGNIQIVVKCDLIDPQAEHMTIMEIRGAKGTEFETIFPWHVGSTLYRPELVAWFGNYAAVWTGKEYGGATVVDLLDPQMVKKMTITPDITGGETAKVKISVRNPIGLDMGSQEINLTDATDVEVDVLLGYTYSFAVVGTGASWTTSAPDAIEVDGDETVTLAITVS